MPGLLIPAGAVADQVSFRSDIISISYASVLARASVRDIIQLSESPEFPKGEA
jgi:hypothetical protein